MSPRTLILVGVYANIAVWVLWDLVAMSYRYPTLTRVVREEMAHSRLFSALVFVVAGHLLWP